MSVCGEIEIAETEIRLAQAIILALQEEMDKQTEIMRLASGLNRLVIQLIYLF